MQQLNSKVSEPVVKPNEIFKHQHHMFNTLVDTEGVLSDAEVVSINISNHSKYVIAVIDETPTLFWIRFYNLYTEELMFEEKIAGAYIKCKEVEQNIASLGSMQVFSMVYFDNGVFYLRTFDETVIQCGYPRKEFEI